MTEKLPRRKVRYTDMREDRPTNTDIPNEAPVAQRQDLTKLAGILLYSEPTPTVEVLEDNSMPADVPEEYLELPIDILRKAADLRRKIQDTPKKVGGGNILSWSEAINRVRGY